LLSKLIHQKSFGLQLDNTQLNFPDGPWKSLLMRAYALFDTISNDGILIPRWSLGGGTVLMFYYGHRKSKDIDIFIPDPQFLGYVNPRTGGHAEDLTSNYSDGSEFVKLFFPEGEIDFVASTTLTSNPFSLHQVLDKNILLESPVEIVAKKLWHRGDRATPRDLLNFAIVIDHQINEILSHASIFKKNIDVFVEQCEQRRKIMATVFDAIEKINCNLSFDDCPHRVKELQKQLNS